MRNHCFYSPMLSPTLQIIIKHLQQKRRPCRAYLLIAFLTILAPKAHPQSALPTGIGGLIRSMRPKGRPKNIPGHPRTLPQTPRDPCIHSEMPQGTPQGAFQDEPATLLYSPKCPKGRPKTRHAPRDARRQDEPGTSLDTPRDSPLLASPCPPRKLHIADFCH